MSLPSVDHLFWLRHDEDRFEVERSRLISDFIKSMPEEHRMAAYAMQCKIDAARLTMSSDELLQWMVREFAELQANMMDQFAFIGHKVADIKKQLDGASGSAQ